MLKSVDIKYNKDTDWSVELPAGQFQRISLFLLLLSDVCHHSLPRPRSGLPGLSGPGAKSHFLCGGRFWFVFSVSPGNKTEVGLFLLRLRLAVPGYSAAV